MRERRRRLLRVKKMNMALVLLFTLCILGAVCFKTVALERQLTQQKEILENYNNEKQKYEEEKEDIQKLKEQINSKEYIEKMAREKFGLVYKDEIIFESEE